MTRTRKGGSASDLLARARRLAGLGRGGISGQGPHELAVEERSAGGAVESFSVKEVRHITVRPRLRHKVTSIRLRAETEFLLSSAGNIAQIRPAACELELVPQAALAASITGLPIAAERQAELRGRGFKRLVISRRKTAERWEGQAAVFGERDKDGFELRFESGEGHEIYRVADDLSVLGWLHAHRLESLGELPAVAAFRALPKTDAQRLQENYLVRLACVQAKFPLEYPHESGDSYAVRLQTRLDTLGLANTEWPEKTHASRFSQDAWDMPASFRTSKGLAFIHLRRTDGSSAVVSVEARSGKTIAVDWMFREPAPLARFIEVGDRLVRLEDCKEVGRQDFISLLR